MHPPPTLPTAPTEQLPERRSRSGFYLAVGCLSVIAGLLLGVGGFFGVRALQDDGGVPVAEEREGSGGADEDGADEGGADEGGADEGGADGGGAEESTEEAVEPAGETLTETPAGPDEAVPFGTAFPLRPSSFDAEAQVAATEVDWDATPEVLEANSFTDEPDEGSRYVMLTLEGVYQGDSAFDGGYASWIRSTYVDEEGASHHRVFVVSPRYDEDIEQAGAEAGGDFRSELVFELPVEVEGGGHLVLADLGQAPEEGVWITVP